MFLWVQAFHLIAVVTWLAALFYLPRLFVYHAMTDATDTVGIERFKVMERKLLNGIMTPSMIIAVALGIWMVMLRPDYMSQGWMHAVFCVSGGLQSYIMARCCGGSRAPPPHERRPSKPEKQMSADPGFVDVDLGEVEMV